LIVANVVGEEGAGISVSQDHVRSLSSSGLLFAPHMLARDRPLLLNHLALDDVQLR
jgi:hypothetical protein